MDLANYEHQSDFARHYFFKGEAAGRTEIVIRQLTYRFGVLSEHERAKISRASKAELDSVSERLLSATSLAAALGDL